MAFVHGLIDKLLESPAVSVTEAGEQLLAALSAGQLGRDAFLNDPLTLVGPPYYASRYLAQVTLRTVKGEYENLKEAAARLSSLTERNPPILGPRRQAAAYRVVLPEANVLDLRYPVKVEGEVWESWFYALVTSGPF